MPSEAWASLFQRTGPVSGAEALTTLGPTSLDHESSATRSHADEETVRPSSAAIVGLKRSLHCLSGPYEKLEPAMLSIIGSRVKTGHFRGGARLAGVLWLPSSREAKRLALSSCSRLFFASALLG